MEDQEKIDYQKATTEWLNKQGYPLEMKVASEFHKLGFGIRQGWYFTDPEEGKPREIDILSTLYIDSGHPFTIQFIVECKYSKKPFVVFTYGTRTEYILESNLLVATPVGKQFIEKTIEKGIYNHLTKIFPSSPRGYAMTQAHISLKAVGENAGSRSKKDYGYEALMKVAKATYSLIDTYSDLTVRKQGDSADYVPAYLAIPLIVVDAPLFECYLDEDNNLEVKSISQSLLVWSYPPLGNIPISVCTINELPNIANVAMEVREELLNFEIIL